MATKINVAASYVIPLLLAYFFVYIPLFQNSSPRKPYTGEEEEQTCDPSTLQESIVTLNTNITCPIYTYTTHILSHSPLIIYIPHFLSHAELTHLITLSLPSFTPSTIYDGQSTTINPRIRNSEVALLPDNDPVVQCLAARAHAFQGFRPNLHIEKFRAQRYGLGGHYAHHYDWTGASRTSDRLSTFMVYLHAECEGGGTNFPRLRRPWGEEWCQWIECGDGEGEGEGVTFKPVQGSAVYFENLRPGGGGGYEETWHAGLPVTRGEKIGLNIWSWLQVC